MRDDVNPIGHNKWLQEYGLALQDRVSCDTLDCLRDATHFTKVKCCGAVVISCRQCMLRLFQTVNIMIKIQEPTMCNQCGTDVNPKGWLTEPRSLVDTAE